MLMALAIVSFSVRSNGMAVWSDGVGYFLYARSLVIDGNFDVTNEFEHLDTKFPSDSKALEPLRKWSSRSADGTLQTPWPHGIGLVMAPFYAAGYAVEAAVAAVQGRQANSYGVIPQAGYILGSVAFGILGFWCLVLICRPLTGEREAYLCALATILCGPLLFYILFHPSMAHAPSFGLIALLTLIWIRAWQKGTTYFSMIALGVVLGLAATVRYQNALFAILPAALGLWDIKRDGFGVALRRAAAAAVACLVPLVLLAGSHVNVDSRGIEGGVTVAQYPVNFASPYFFEVLFSCRHGAFHWSPVLALGVLGLLWTLFAKPKVQLVTPRTWAAVLLATFAAHVYLMGGLGLSTVAYVADGMSSGWLHHWDDAPSFGMRYLSECAPIFAVGLACLMYATRRYLHVALWMIVLGVLAAWNGLLVVAYGMETITRSGCLPYSDMLSGFASILGKVLARF